MPLKVLFQMPITLAHSEGNLPLLYWELVANYGVGFVQRNKRVPSNQYNFSPFCLIILGISD